MLSLQTCLVLYRFNQLTFRLVWNLMAHSTLLRSFPSVPFLGLSGHHSPTKSIQGFIQVYWEKAPGQNWEKLSTKQQNWEHNFI